jgi:ATP-dependent helicase/DNAse subunit B
MAKDPYSAVWVSHSSMGDFLKCPRAYYLHNVYKDPNSNRKINIVNPALALGVAVHEVVENLANFKTEERFNHSLIDDLEKAWEKVSGKWGGFNSLEEEAEVKARAVSMIKRVENNPGLLAMKAVKIKENESGMPPHFYLSEEENIILCGKIDWLVWKPEDDSVHILDFKTGKNEENEDSLQLPIYQLLLKKLQKRKVTGASYWYLDKDDNPVEVDLPNLDESYRKVFEVAKRVKDARQKGEFNCPKGEEGCFYCKPFEKILKGEAEYIGKGEMRQDLYMIRK